MKFLLGWLMLLALVATIGGCAAGSDCQTPYYCHAETATPTGAAAFAAASCPPPPLRLGVVVDDALHVLDILPSSAAEAHGIQPGDTIVGIGEASPTDAAHAKQWVEWYTRNAEQRSGLLPIVTVTLTRGKQQISEEIPLCIPPPRQGPPPTPIPPGEVDV